MSRSRSPVPARRVASTASTLAVVGVFVPLIAAGPGEAAAASLSTRYACTSDYGTQTTEVRVSADFPSHVASGSTVAARRAGFVVTVPPEYVTGLRRLGVRSVSGVGRRATFGVGSTRHPLTGVRLPRAAVPARGALVLRGSGTASSFRAPAPGRYAVRVPSSFLASLTLRTDSGSSALEMRCVLERGAPARLGTLTAR